MVRFGLIGEKLGHSRSPNRITSYNVCYTKLLRNEKEGFVQCIKLQSIWINVLMT